MPEPRKNQKGRDDMAENPLMVVLGDKSSKEEKQEEVKEQRKNFVNTQKAIVDNIGKRIETMTNSIVRSINDRSSFLSKAIKFLFTLIPSIFLSASNGLKKILEFGEKGFARLSGFFSDTLPKIIARVENFVDIAKTRFLKILGAVKPEIVKRFSAIFSALKEIKVGKFIAGFLDKLKPAFTFFSNIIKKFKPVLNVFSDFFSKAGKFPTFAESIFGKIGKIASDGLKKILGFGEKGFARLSGFFSDTLPKIIARVENFIARVENFVDIAKTRFLKILGAVKPAIVKRFSAIFSALKETKVGKFIAGFLDKLKPAFTFFSNIINKFKPVLNVFGGFFSKAGKFATFSGSIFGKIGKIFGVLGRFLKPVFNVISKISKFFKAIPLLGQIITAVEGIIGFFRGFLGSEGSLMDKLINGIKGFFAQIISGFTFGLLSFEDVMGYIDGFIDGIGSFFTGIIPFFTKTIPNIFNNGVDSIISFFTNIGTFFSETIPAFFKGLYNSFIHFHTVTIPEFFTKTIPDFFMNFSTRIGEYLDMAGSFLYDIFVQPWIDLGGYISDMFTKAKNFILDGLIGLVNTFNYGGVLDSAIETLQGFKTQAAVPTGTKPTGGFDPVAIQEKVNQQLNKVANQARAAIAQRDQVIIDLQRQLADKVSGAVNVSNNVTNTTSYPTDSEPASEVDPTLRRAVQPMPY